MSFASRLPDLAFVRVLTAGGPYAEDDILSVAFVSPLVGRLAAHGSRGNVPDPFCLSAPLVPECISTVVVRSSAVYLEGDELTLSFVDPGVARIHPGVAGPTHSSNTVRARADFASALRSDNSAATAIFPEIEGAQGIASPLPAQSAAGEVPMQAVAAGRDALLVASNRPAHGTADELPALARADELSPHAAQQPLHSLVADPREVAADAVRGHGGSNQQDDCNQQDVATRRDAAERQDVGTVAGTLRESGRQQDQRNQHNAGMQRDAGKQNRVGNQPDVTAQPDAGKKEDGGKQHRIVAGISILDDSLPHMEAAGAGSQLLATHAGVRVRLHWTSDRVRRFVRVVDKLFTVDRLGWYRHSLAMRLLVPDQISTGDELSDVEAMRHLHALRGVAVETLGRPLLAALMPNFTVTQDWLDGLDSAAASRALGGLRDAIEPHVDDTRWPGADELDPAWTVGTVERQELARAPGSSVEALLPVLIASVSPSVGLSEKLAEYRHALRELFGQTAQCADAVRLNQMSVPNHSLDDRLWQLVGVVGDTFGALGSAS